MTFAETIKSEQIDNSTGAEAHAVVTDAINQTLDGIAERGLHAGVCLSVFHLGEDEHTVESAACIAAPSGISEKKAVMMVCALLQALENAGYDAATIAFGALAAVDRNADDPDATTH